MEYRSNKNQLLAELRKWDSFLPGRTIHLIACGGTALTLLGYKESTKDVDFIVPDKKEYERLVEFLTSAGYKNDSGGWMYPGESIKYDLYEGNRVFTTNLLDSPLDEGKNIKIMEFKKIYLGALNPIDLIITKMFRGTSVDRQDCNELAKYEKIDLHELEKRYRETASYEIAEERVLKNLELILDDIRKILKEQSQ